MVRECPYKADTGCCQPACLTTCSFYPGNQKREIKALNMNVKEPDYKLIFDGASDHLSLNDTVNHPSHYTDGKIETIDYIEDKKLNYHLGNAVKYISRAGKKDPDKYTEDLKKAVWYLNREIERVSR